MDLSDFKDHVDKRFDNLEEKVDTVIVNETANKTDISWLKGHVKFTTVVFTTLFTGLLLYLLTGTY